MAIELYKNRCSVYEGEKPFIFISYSHQDIERVVRLIRRLQSEGFRIWYDSGIQAGAEWPEEVATHIKNCGCVLSLLSKNSTKSRHFKEEFNYAHHLQKPILVAYLEKCELTPGVEMRVVSQQCIDCEHCENDEDLIQQIAQAKILLSCLGEKEEGESRVGSADTGIADGAPVEKKENTTKPKGEKPADKIAQLRVKAEAGDPEAQADLAWAYDQGKGVAQSYEEAVRWLKRAADQGHARAQNNLGVTYQLGNGVAQNYEEAVKWYRKAADQGHTSAQWNLGTMYEYGVGVDQDWQEAAVWYEKAAEQGFAMAQKKMTRCYREGLGVPVDEEKAKYWEDLYKKNPKK